VVAYCDLLSTSILTSLATELAMAVILDNFWIQMNELRSRNISLPHARNQPKPKLSASSLSVLTVLLFCQVLL